LGYIKLKNIIMEKKIIPIVLMFTSSLGLSESPTLALIGGISIFLFLFYVTYRSFKKIKDDSKKKEEIFKEEMFEKFK